MAVEQLLPYLYEELHGLARQLMGGERSAHTLQPTALINEAYMRLGEAGAGAAEDRSHFIRLAARAMRQVLVDHARARKAKKRGGEQAQVTLDESLVAADGEPEDLLEVHEALHKLAGMDPQLSQLVELRFFGGLREEQIAATLGMSVRSVQRSWRAARAWLRREMSQARGGGTASEEES